MEPLGYNTATTTVAVISAAVFFYYSFFLLMEELAWVLINLYNQDETGSASCCVGIDVCCTVIYSKSMRQQQAKTDQCLGWTAQLSAGGRQMMLQETLRTFHSLKSDITHIQALQSQSNIKPTPIIPNFFQFNSLVRFCIVRETQTWQFCQFHSLTRSAPISLSMVLQFS